MASPALQQRHEESLEITPQPGPQEAVLSSPADIVIGGGAAGGGKVASANHSIITPWGEKPVLDVMPGDLICDPFGGVQTVKARYPHRDWDFYEFSFSDGTRAETSPEHIWLAWRSHVGRKIGGRRVFGQAAAELCLTSELIQRMEKGQRFRIPLCAPVVGNGIHANVDGYLLGALLGDACLQQGGVVLTCAFEDAEIVDLCSDALDIPLYRQESQETETTGSWRLSADDPAYGWLKTAGMLNKRAWEKSLPEWVYSAPVEWRWSLLQGLMDTDGWCEQARAAYFSTTSQQLRDGVAKLARSLGCFVTVTDKHPTYTHNGELREGRPAWALRLKCATPEKLFQLKRKKAVAEGLRFQSLSKEIVDYRYLGKMDGACHTVAHPSGLYMLDDYTVTHNTYGLLMEPLRWLAPMSMLGPDDMPIDFRAVIFRRKMTEVTVQGGMWDVSKEIYGAAGGTSWITPSRRWQWSVARSTLEVRFAHLEHEKNAYDWQGAQLAMVGFDELTEFTEWMFWYLQTRLRTIDPRISPYVRATTNPEADSWVKKLIDWWIDPATGYAIPERSGVIRWFVRRNSVLHWADTPEELEHFKNSRGEPLRARSLTFIPSTLDDNPKMYEADPGYIDRLETQDLVDVERLRYGNWNIRSSAGLYFQREWCGDPIDPGSVPPLVKIVRGWDLAATEPSPATPDPDWTCGTKIGVDANGRFYVLDHVAERFAPHGVEQLIKNVATTDGRRVTVAIPQDPAQAGKSQVVTLGKLLAGFPISFQSAAGDKLTRFKSFSAQCGIRNVSVVRGAWNERWFRELENFPPSTKHGHDDDADSTSEAFNSLVMQPGQPMVGTYSMR